MASAPVKIVVIMGPTASGKTRLAVALSRLVDGEIVSADSRQVYRGLDIGTGKDLYEYDEVPYHLIDICDPDEAFSVSRFQELAHSVLADIVSRGKTPIICGGSGHYIKALIEDYAFPHPPTQPAISVPLEDRPRQELYGFLKSLGLWSDRDWSQDSRRRMARAIEKASSPVLLKAAPPSFGAAYSVRLYYTVTERSVLRSRIEQRLLQRIRQGMVAEVSRLLDRGFDITAFQRLGLEYRWVSLYLSGRLSFAIMLPRLYTAICHYAKRQLTFIRYLEKSGQVLHPVLSPSAFLVDASNWLSTPV